MLIDNLPDLCFAAAEQETDHRFTKLAKWIDGVDPEAKNMYGLSGDMIKAGTIDVNIPTKRAAICYSVTGSRNNQTTHYSVVIVNPDGTVEATEIKDEEVSWDRRTKGAILRLRQPIQKLLESLNGSTEAKTKIEFEASQEFIALMLRASEKFNPTEATDPERLLTVALNTYLSQ